MMPTSFWGVPAGMIYMFYLAVGFSLAICLSGLISTFYNWSNGRDTDDVLYGKKNFNLLLLSIFKTFSTDVLKGKRVFLRNKTRGIMFIFLVPGFLVLFIGTIMRSIDAWGFHFLKDFIWKIFSFTLDITGLMFIIAMIYYIARSHTTPDKKQFRVKIDLIVLYILLAIAFTGFFVEAIRLYVARPGDAIWSPIGLLFSVLIPGSVSQDAMGRIYPLVWFIHAMLSLSFIAMLPYTKYIHVFATQITTCLAGSSRNNNYIAKEWVCTEEINKHIALKQEQPTPPTGC